MKSTRTKRHNPSQVSDTVFHQAEQPRILGGLQTNTSCNLIGWGGARVIPPSKSVNIYGQEYCKSGNPQVFCSASSNSSVCEANLASPVICGSDDTVNGFLISESGCESKDDNRLYYHSVSDHADWINKVLSSDFPKDYPNSGTKFEPTFCEVFP
ncbi:CLUMA_CG002228, isoform A [Clunio marinus]|uniref:CLUMA_CG002228, isoform A n=1 Tax=Clunio marinus TaxID=568069 RepID=A0A1J1HK82_9DIPT|nr:CLUMA_CG002228, isoform A [Clunio marinus]